jgi:hypothetical protein
MIEESLPCLPFSPSGVKILVFPYDQTTETALNDQWLKGTVFDQYWYSCQLLQHLKNANISE